MPPSIGHISRRPPGLLQVRSIRCDALVEAEPQALGLTYWFDAAPHGDPYTAVVRFVGHRIGVDREPGPRDTFIASERVERVIPGSGRNAITARVFDIDPGEWNITAALTTQRHAGWARPSPRLAKPQWVSRSGRTGFGPIIRASAPGAHLGAWPALVGAGLGVALDVQARLAAHAHLPVEATLSVSLIASVVGLLGARIYHVAEQSPRLLLNPRSLVNSGMCIQGFVLAAIATASIGMVLIGVPAGRFLDVTAPGLLFGMSIGRLGCFFGGCCAGRPTASRWGLWSSDRRLTTRRIPTQLLESALALGLGLAALLVVLKGSVGPDGAVFVAAIAGYTLGRQVLLPWRDLPRKTPHGRRLTAAVAAAVVLADIAVTVLS
jgi:phosphatidylglycerol:prolipoprotein diacylglycerol transferase